MCFITNHKYMLIFPAFISRPTSLLVPNIIPGIFLLLIFFPKEINIISVYQKLMRPIQFKSVLVYLDILNDPFQSKAQKHRL
jgi:hypothetical protein